MFKFAIITLLILIIYNLVMGFVYILKDKSSSNRGLTSLKTRIVSNSHHICRIDKEPDRFNLERITEKHLPDKITSHHQLKFSSYLYY